MPRKKPAAVKPVDMSLFQLSASLEDKAKQICMRVGSIRLSLKTSPVANDNAISNDESSGDFHTKLVRTSDWLDSAIKDIDTIQNIICPHPADTFKATRQRSKKVDNNGIAQISGKGTTDMPRGVKGSGAASKKAPVKTAAKTATKKKAPAKKSKKAA